MLKLSSVTVVTLEQSLELCFSFLGLTDDAYTVLTNLC